MLATRALILLLLTGGYATAHGGVRWPVSAVQAVSALNGICVQSYPSFQKADALRTQFELFDRVDGGRVAHHDLELFVHLNVAGNIQACSIIYGSDMPRARMLAELGQIVGRIEALPTIATARQGNTNIGVRVDQTTGPNPDHTYISMTIISFNPD